MDRPIDFAECCTQLAVGVAEEAPVTFNLYQPVLLGALGRRAGAPELTEALLRRAYHCVCHRHPILRAHRDPQRHRGVLAVPPLDPASGTAAPVAVHGAVPGVGCEELWARAVAREAGGLLWDSPWVFQIDALLLDPAADARTAALLVAHFNHGVGDGTAFAVALADLVAVLNRAGPDGSLPPLGCLGEPRPLPRLALERFPNHFFPNKDCTSAPERARLVDRGIASLKANTGSFRHLLRDARLDEGQTRRLVAACKSHGVTVTAAVFAAMLIAIDARSVATVMPVSLRSPEEMRDVSPCCRVMPMLVPDLDPEAVCRQDLWAVARHLKGKIAALRAGLDAPQPVPWMGAIPDTLVDPDPSLAQPDMYSLGAQAAAQKRTGAFLSNIGVVDPIFEDPQAGPAPGWELQDLALFCVNKHTVIEGGAWCLTFRNRLHIAFLDSTPPHQQQAFDLYVDKTMELLCSTA